MKSVKDGKWWKHFLNFCYNSKLEDGREKDFIEELFCAWDSDDKIYPYVLSQKIAKDAELSVAGKRKTQEISETDYIKLTLKKAAAWARQNKICDNKLGRFLSDSVCITRALRGEYYKPLFMFCSDFLSRYGNLSEDDLLKKSSIRAFHPELYESLKTALNTKFRD